MTGIQGISNEKRDVLVYDGKCHFCVNQIDRIRSMGGDAYFEYLPRQSHEFEQRFPALKSMDFEEGMRYIDSDGAVYIGADAVYQIARRLPLTSWFAWAYNLPVCKPLARAIYKWIAANRKRLGKTCEGGACVIHPDEGG